MNKNKTLELSTAPAERTLKPAPLTAPPEQAASEPVSTPFDPSTLVGTCFLLAVIDGKRSFAGPFFSRKHATEAAVGLSELSGAPVLVLVGAEAVRPAAKVEE